VLCACEYRSELEKLRERYYFFHHSLFAVYVRAAARLESIHLSVEEESRSRPPRAAPRPKF